MKSLRRSCKAQRIIRLGNMAERVWAAPSLRGRARYAAYQMGIVLRRSSYSLGRDYRPQHDTHRF